MTHVLLNTIKNLIIIVIIVHQNVKLVQDQTIINVYHAKITMFYKMENVFQIVMMDIMKIMEFAINVLLHVKLAQVL